MVMEQLNRPKLTDKRFKMRLKQSEFLSEFGGRIPAGSVVPVDEETAIRWIDNGIAVQAPNDAKTRQEERREEILAELERIEEEQARGGVFNASITRDSFRDDEQAGIRDPMPRRMPVPARRGRKPAASQGAVRAGSGRPTGARRADKAERPAFDDAETVNGDGYRDIDEDES